MTKAKERSSSRSLSPTGWISPQKNRLPIRAAGFCGVKVKIFIVAAIIYTLIFSPLFLIRKRRFERREKNERVKSQQKKKKRQSSFENCRFFFGDPYEIRTRVAGVRGRSLRPLDQRAWCTIRGSNPGHPD